MIIVITKQQKKVKVLIANQVLAQFNMRNKQKEKVENLEDSNTEPKLEDFYDCHDPRGCSTSEYNEYLKAVAKFKENQTK